MWVPWSLLQFTEFLRYLTARKPKHGHLSLNEYDLLKTMFVRWNYFAAISITINLLNELIPKFSLRSAFHSWRCISESNDRKPFRDRLRQLIGKVQSSIASKKSWLLDNITILKCSVGIVKANINTAVIKGITLKTSPQELHQSPQYATNTLWFTIAIRLLVLVLVKNDK